MRTTAMWAGAALVAAVLGGACGGETGGSGGASSGETAGSGGASGDLCTPGAEFFCRCPDGSSSHEVCAADGSSVGPCLCEGTASSTTHASSASSSASVSATTGVGGSGGGAASSGEGGATVGAGGDASSGAGGSIPCAGGAIDLHGVTLYANPPDLADWPVTASLTEVDFTNDGVHVAFTKQDGDGRWPDVIPPGWDGPLQYTLGLVECIDGQWYASAVIEFWYGLYAEGGNLAVDDQVARNWYYDAGRWGMLAGHQPRAGETIGVFVAAGNLRNITTDDDAQSPVRERSNVVLVPFPDANGANHSF